MPGTGIRWEHFSEARSADALENIDVKLGKIVECMETLIEMFSVFGVGTKLEKV